ncbi:MAG: amidohydrolase [Spirochaetales bacterium]|nr:amidohydrolase [Spirochaetales bacterium]
MIDGIEIVDAHMHIMTAATNRWIRQRLGEKDPGYRRAYQLWSDGFRKRYDSELGEENEDPPEKLARDWARELDRHGVDRAVFVALYPEEDELTQVIEAGGQRFYAFATVDPREADAAQLLRRRIVEQGYVGLKLYPTTMAFLPSDRAVYPLYEECRSLGVPVLFHLGITLQYEADLRYANPIELHPVLKDFPEVPFIIAHFGAGYFREVLFLAYHVNNLHVDTCGKNVWIDYLPYRTTLSEVFERTLQVFGPERIIFGTDSRMLSRGYRRAVLRQQLGILRSLELGREEISLIMGANILRLIGGSKT